MRAMPRELMHVNLRREVGLSPIARSALSSESAMKASTSLKKKKNRSEQVLKIIAKLAPTAIQHGGSGASFRGGGGSILEPFWASGRVLALKCVLDGVLGGSWAI